MQAPQILRIVKWVVPMFGNDFSEPYGTLEITDGATTRLCRTHQAAAGQAYFPQYVCFNRRRWLVKNTGTLTHPQIGLIAS